MLKPFKGTSSRALVYMFHALLCSLTGICQRTPDLLVAPCSPPRREQVHTEHM